MNFDPISFAMGMNAAKGSEGSSGGGVTLDGIYIKTTGMKIPGSSRMPQRWFMYNGELYAIVNQNTGDSVVDFYKYSNNAWTKIITGFNAGLARVTTSLCIIEYNGKIHMLCNDMPAHVVFDGATATKLNNLPKSPYYSSSACIYNGKIISSDGYKMYEWDEATDTWTQIMDSVTYIANFATFFVHEGNLYSKNENKIYKLNISANTAELVFENAYRYADEIIQIGTDIYYFTDQEKDIYKYDPVSNTETYLGKTPIVAITQVYDGKLKGINGKIGNADLCEVEYILP